MSAIGLNPVPLSVAGPILAKANGLRWPEDRVRVVELANKYRNLLYNLYEEVKLFDEVSQCICLSDFREPCVRDCDPVHWKGFTLPYDVASVESAWESGNVLTQRSRWRESLVGRHNPGAFMEMFEVPGQFATERDLREVTRLKVYADSVEDNGLTVEVKVVDADWEHQTLAFSLQGDGWVTVDNYVREIISVVLPGHRDGGIRLAQEDGYELSRYTPNEPTPAYRRYKVAAHCNSEAVLIQGTRRMVPVYFDSDIVEVGDQLVMEAAARYFKYGENTTDQKDIKRAEYDLAKMKESLSGLLARNRGRSKQDGTPYQGRPLPRRRKQLPGY